MNAVMIEDWDDDIRLQFLENHVKMGNGWPYSRGIGHAFLAQMHLEQMRRISALVQHTQGKGAWRRGDNVVEDTWAATQIADTRDGPVELDNDGLTYDAYKVMLASRRALELPTFTISGYWDEFMSYEVPHGASVFAGGAASGDSGDRVRGGGEEGGGLVQGGPQPSDIRFAFGKHGGRWYYVCYNIALSYDELG